MCTIGTRFKVEIPDGSGLPVKAVSAACRGSGYLDMILSTLVERPADTPVSPETETH